MSTETRAPVLAFQGVKGAFSHQAGQLFAGLLDLAEPPHFLPCETFAQVFENVLSYQARYGVVPLENSTIGSIVANYDLLWLNPVVIVSELSIPIHHHLLALPGTEIAVVRQVYSHPAALDQCRRFFDQESHLRPVSHFDTSGAAKYVSELKNQDCAAIAGELAASEYGLEILRRNLEDYPYNRTRFALLAASNAAWQAAQPVPKPPYKISSALELPHKPGSLALLLTRLASLELNLTKIESRPIPEAPWHYRFFIDMELSEQDQDESVIKVMEDTTEAYRLLGRYRTWEA